MPHLALFVLGPPRIELDDKPVVLDRNKAVALLVYLAVTEAEHSRQSLATLFWPEYEQNKAYAYLRRSLWTLNQALGEGWILAGRDTVALQPDASLWLDSAQFQRRLAECGRHGHALTEVCTACRASLTEAVDLYQGDFLAGFSLRDSPEFDDWQFFQAEGLRRELSEGLERLSRCQSAEGDLEAALASARRWLGLDILNEAAHRQLMRFFTQAGQRSAALRQYQECARLLQAELNVMPEQETQQLYEQIKSNVFDTRRPTESLQPSIPLYLPHQPTPFVGRLDELAEITGLLGSPDCRLLTLVGPGGIGKTRLAIEAARQVAVQGESGKTAQFSRGIYFVPLAPLHSDGFLIQTIGDVLNISFRTEESPQLQLINYLREKPILLVMDNFEHLISGAGLLSEILAAAPAVKILATSRLRLNLREEWVLEVGGMPFPESEQVPTFEDFSAIRLFLQHARRARLDFSLSVDEKPAVIRICQLVQGMPLGIELSAAWVKMLSCREIAAEIEQNLDFLTTSVQGVPERHQSLRAVFEHSWNLLSEAERDAFQKLSVFRGSFSRAAAEAVIIGHSAPSRYSLLSLLSALVDKSMLRRSPSGRYQMHELLKQYAAEKLEQALEEYRHARDLHCVFYAEFLDQMMIQLRGEKQLEALQRIEEEIEDLRAAWQWAVSQGRLAEIRQSCPALSLFYNIRSRPQEGEEVFNLAASHLHSMLRAAQAVGAATLEIESLLAITLREQSRFLNNQGHHERSIQLFKESLAIVLRLEAQPGITPQEKAFLFLLLDFGAFVLAADEVERLYQESLRIFEESGDVWNSAMAKLSMASFAEFSLADPARARKLRYESLANSEALGDRWAVSNCLTDLAAMAISLGEYDEAQRLSQRSLALSRELNDRWGTIWCLLNLGQSATALGAYPQAKDYYQASLEQVSETGNRSLTAVNLDCSGYVDYLMGNYAEAERNYRQSLALNRQNGDERGAGMALMNLGDVALALGDPLLARQRYREGLNLIEPTNMTWGIIICLKKLGNVACIMGDYDQSRDYYRQALRNAAPFDRFPEVLEILIGMAELHAKVGRPEQAIELLAASLSHPALSREAKNRAEHLLADLKAELPPELLAAAQAHGSAFALPTLVTEILEETSRYF